MNYQEILSYYSREDVQNALLEFAKNREVVGVYTDGGYSKRPNTIVYPGDILSMVKSGVIEFHASLERWSQPLAIKEGNQQNLRIGWDLILDIDCDFVEHGKITAKVLIDVLKKHGVKTAIKFSGGTGFHLGIGWEAIPKEIDYKKTETLYPNVARSIAVYLKDVMREDLEKAFLKIYSAEDLAKNLNIELGKLVTKGGIDPFQITEIDPILISPRHLFRAPYSLNRKTFCVSLPIKPENIEAFERNQASPNLVKTDIKFLDGFEENEAELLVTEALDFQSRNKVVEVKKPFKEVEFKGRIGQETFPPCVKLIAEGLAEGRKRSLFILLNFLSSIKWKHEEIEKFIVDWNQKNKPPLPDSYVRGQIRYHLNKDKTILPPNCPSEESKGWYDSFDVCRPDSICGTPKIVLKNPVNYPFKILGAQKKEKPKRPYKATNFYKKQAPEQKKYKRKYGKDEVAW